MRLLWIGSPPGGRRMLHCGVADTNLCSPWSIWVSSALGECFRRPNSALFERSWPQLRAAAPRFPPRRTGERRPWVETSARCFYGPRRVAFLPRAATLLNIWRAKLVCLDARLLFAVMLLRGINYCSEVWFSIEIPHCLFKFFKFNFFPIMCAYMWHELSNCTL